ncbi:helix-turn-helix domain-containing protein [Arthrobacter sp. AL08]|uniref:winged helix-turn-helix transcriptional regulator n=1 Tax=unclassified Arthrobacter TaxID=235627 RepID=UPI00249B7A3E|nr:MULTISPECIES: helix-turn-helix domain-containing protein [unclassified Arthrobacter]MDI3243144.1 helix-turn-helix domain-containing protein [Arthrobacter sp. AL05]MDI3279154.1 helix-turn-helix domain-containing protein [Arthrobacter sp. AL08]
MSLEDGTLTAPGHLAVTAVGRRGDLFDPRCPTRQLLDRIGGKWVAMAITVLGAEWPTEVRFAELKRRMPGVSQKMLAQTLRSLERDSLVARRVEATTPPRVHYALTELGITLCDPIAALREWAELNMAAIDDAATAWDAAH